MNHFSEINQLPTEVKALVVNGITMTDKAKAALEQYKYSFDLTSKRELKADIKFIEKYIELIKRGKVTEKNVTELEKGIIRLNTILTGLIQFFGNEA